MRRSDGSLAPADGDVSDPGALHRPAGRRPAVAAPYVQRSSSLAGKTAQTSEVILEEETRPMETK